MSTPAERVAEFVRQARRLKDINPAKFHSVWTDPEASDAFLSLDDLEALLESKADMWDEGYRDCFTYHVSEGAAGRQDNPYRTEETGNGTAD